MLFGMKWGDISRSLEIQGTVFVLYVYAVTLADTFDAYCSPFSLLVFFLELKSYVYFYI